MEVVAFVLPGESLSLAHAGHVNALPRGEHLHAEPSSDSDVAGIAQLLEAVLRLQPGAFEVSAHRLGRALHGLVTEAELQGLVSVGPDRLALHDAARVRLEHRDRDRRSLRREDLGHAHLAGENPFAHSLISMLTPLGRLRRMSAST